ncbi:hypothetical protein MSAN_02101300 [Mycena sanguinolenta]|uniref:Uncharacterized protein n=1 Tax=Mycena sanguinolenta TaxID=230812 RepID=A0A8H6XI09_9AGAR|nr:hypothetical protein MSAN_02101300 [Mycena sanguinolenta]
MWQRSPPHNVPEPQMIWTMYFRSLFSPPSRNLEESHTAAGTTYTCSVLECSARNGPHFSIFVYFPPLQDMVDSSQIDPSWFILMRSLSVTGVSLLLYGIYICLFLLSIHLLARRRATHGRKFLMAWSCVIAAGATMQLAVTLARAVEDARFVENLLHAEVPNSNHILLTAQNVIGIINIFVADFLYLYRCYVIWDCRWKILILPGLLMVSTFVVGLVGAHATTGLSVTKPQIVFTLATATNLFFTTLTSE